MSDTTFMVGRVTGVVPSPELSGGAVPAAFNLERLTITLEPGGEVTVHGRRAQTWFSDLRSLMADERPASLEIDPDTGEVMTLRLPVVTRVQQMHQITGDRYAISLVREEVDYQLRESDERQRRVLAALRRSAAMDQDVVVTIDRARGTIVDAIPSAAPSLPLPLEPLPPADDLLFRLQPVARADLQPIFDELNRQDCPHSSVEPGDTCIPLRFPDLFCNTIASVVCHMLEARHLPAAKLWLRGAMVLHTNNHPSCRVEWNTHVAALVRVHTTVGHTELAVIDPAVSRTAALSRAEWHEQLARTPECRPIAIPSPTDTYWLYSETNYLKERPDSVSDDLKALRREYGKRIVRCGLPPYECCE